MLDANVILRLLTEDDAGQSRRATALFKSAAEGTVDLVLSPPVLFEVAWTLRRAYHCPRLQVLKLLSDLLSTPGVLVTDAKVVGQAIQIAQSKGLEFADAYIAAAAMELKVGKVATFNVKDFKPTGLEALTF